MPFQQNTSVEKKEMNTYSLQAEQRKPFCTPRGQGKKANKIQIKKRVHKDSIVDVHGWSWGSIRLRLGASPDFPFLQAGVI